MEWVWRSLLALAIVAAGYLGTTRTLAYTIRLNPTRAHVLAPNDGRITALAAQALSVVNATAADRARADVLARLALRQDPTAVSAVSVLGVNAQVRGDTARARQIFTYAQALSRRDLQTQLWSIEDAVSRSDVTDALRHYDVALRTIRHGSDLLFPILGGAIADAPVREALVSTLAGNPIWGGTFIDYVAGNGPDPRVTARLFEGLRHAGVAISPGANATLVSNLISHDLAQEAWSYYVSVHRSADRRQSRDERFAADPAAASPFDWRLLGGAGVSTAILRGDQGGIFDFSASPSTGGALLQQIQILPPGNYRIEGHSANIDQPAGGQPYWRLLCQDGHEIGRATVSNSTQANGIFIGDFMVSAECPVQTLALIAPPSNRLDGVSGQIDRIRLYPVDR